MQDLGHRRQCKEINWSGLSTCRLLSPLPLLPLKSCLLLRHWLFPHVHLEDEPLLVREYMRELGVQRHIECFECPYRSDEKFCAEHICSGGTVGRNCAALFYRSFRVCWS